MNWEKIKAEFESSNVSMKDIAIKYDINPSTLRSRKNRKKWQRNNATQRNATKENVATQKRTKKPRSDAKVSRKGMGNPKPTHKFTEHNRVNLKHGLFSKFLHEEQVEIMELMEGQSVTEQLWLQIQINFSSIIRMQKIMYVADQDDDSRKIVGNSWGSEGGGETYKHIFAFEKYESYIKAQTRAMAEQRNLIKQFHELTDEFDERRLRIKLIENQVEKSDLEIKEIKASIPGEGEHVDDGFLAAMDNSLESVWGDFDG